jgi:hypothetical protein
VLLSVVESAGFAEEEFLTRIADSGVTREWSRVVSSNRDMDVDLSYLSTFVM